MALAGLVSVVILSGFVSFEEKSLTMSATDMALAGLVSFEIFEGLTPAAAGFLVGFASFGNSSGLAAFEPP